MPQKPDLADYITVAQRIQIFREKHPQGSLQPWDPARPYEIEEVGNEKLIVVVAAAYRNPEDPRPGVGMAAEPFPGKTPYTRGSELMNAETSAWGRAIVAALGGDTSLSIASAEEVRNRRDEQDPDTEHLRKTAAKADPAKVARMLQHVEDQDFVKRARNAKTVDEVRTAWKAAGAAGALKTQVVNPVTGEVCTLQEYFTYRADEIGMAKAVETVQEAFPEAEVIGA